MSDVRHAVSRAIRLHVDGKLDAAVDAYQAVLKRYPRTCACWVNLGAALQKLGRKDEALKVLRHGERICPESVGLRLNLGAALASAGDLAGALEQYRAALARDPGNPAAAIACGATLLQLDRFEQAIDHCRAAMHRHPDNAKLYHTLGWAFWRLWRAEAAVAAYERAIALGPAPVLYREDLHYALHVLGRYAEDEQQLRVGLARDEDSPVLLAALGQCLIDQGRLDQGLDCCKGALAVDPDCAKRGANAVVPTSWRDAMRRRGETDFASSPHGASRTAAAGRGRTSTGSQSCSTASRGWAT